jgi:hypothetical protein
MPPLYTAETLWFPAVKVEMLPLVATPPVTATALPKALPSIKNWTVPTLGLPVIFAVKVTALPYVDVLELEETAVVVVMVLA